MSAERRSKSSELYQRALAVIPGGVNSPVRAFRAVGLSPLFIDSASGCMITDADGTEYIDYVGSWGPMILGHRNPAIIAALADAASRGTSFGAPTELEIQLAEEVRAAFPSIDLIRMVSSGTEAAMSAIRLARGFTGRDLIVKFEGCYHGHSDSLLVKAGSGLATFGTPDSAGVPAAIASNTLVVPYNSPAALEAAFSARPGEIAAVIAEPIAGNMGCVAPRPGFLNALREITTRQGALLIFDEVITGFRVALGGAQEFYGIKPDITCLGKIIGGGLPVGAFGGSARVMECIAPLGQVYQAGTLSGNPLAMAAGLATLKLLRQSPPYAELERMGGLYEEGLKEAAEAASVPLVVNRVGSMVTGFFTSEPVVDWPSAKQSDAGRYARFFQAMLDQGVYLAPSQFECAFLSAAHTDDLIRRTARAAALAMKAI